MKIAIAQIIDDYDRRSSACYKFLAHVNGATVDLINIHKSKQNLRYYDLVCFIGYKAFTEVYNKGLPPYIILDGGYFSDGGNKHWWHLAWGGINGLGRYYQTHFDSSRNDYTKDAGLDIVGIQENHTKEYILVLAQNPYDPLLLHRKINYHKWIDQVCNNLHNISDKPICLRPTPKLPLKFAQLPRIKPPKFVTVLSNNKELIHEQIRKASITVAFSSSAGMYSLVHGVPHISCDPASIVYDVTPHTFDSIDSLSALNLQRVQTKLDQLMWQCWTLEEISDGKPIDILINGFGPEGVNNES